MISRWNSPCAAAATLVLASGCTDAAAPVAATATPTVNQALAEQCSALLQNVRAGGNITVNIKCDIPTEVQLVSAVSKLPWEKKCDHTYPSSGWHVDTKSPDLGYTVMPDPGSYFAQFDFEFSIDRQGISQVDFVFVHALSWEDTQRLLPVALDPADYKRIAEISALYAGEATFDAEARDLILSQSDAPIATQAAKVRASRVGMITARRKVQLEDGQDLVDLMVPIHSDNRKYTAQIGLFDYVSAYPSWSTTGDNEAYSDLRCSAKTNINIKTFKSLCTMFFEQYALDPKLTSMSQCEGKN